VAIIARATIEAPAGLISWSQAHQERRMKDRDDIWEKTLSPDDLKSAQRYLALLFTEQDAEHLIKAFRRAPCTGYPAKDLLRASQTHLLDKDAPEIVHDLKKIKKGKKLSPVLLVRGDGNVGATLTIADGHHRICASWHWDEKCPVACCVVDHPFARRRGRQRHTKK
jgi:hypothetical protein